MKVEKQDPVIEVATPWDLTVKVEEEEVRRKYGADGRRGITTTKKSASFRVDKDTLINASWYFRTMLSGSWNESQTNTILLKGDTLKSMEVWFRALHSTLSAMPMDSISIAEIWHTIQAGDKYGLDRARLRSGFRTWWSSEATADRLTDMNVCRQLMFPAYAFDYTLGFRAVTRALVYNWPGHITEMRPNAIKHNLNSDNKMHLRPRVIQQLNATKADLRNKIYRCLFMDFNFILKKAKCTCHEETLCNYLRELSRIGVQPLGGELPHRSIKDIIDSLGRFNEENMRSKKAPTVRGVHFSSTTAVFLGSGSHSVY
ncbi:hypothetical protein AJ80_09414 [Polytolypa hystricis UAMH7299]|uniref:BTB domain-containing protein n=1 Tax=Polytolypa hystricis (strain UAMH7299) TaxID=1447883 RepID=A0A2B7WR37_POLH7|nr:hypothetical protein AJ80_09414 [Polytolypa hystricis UAMH7299]